MPRTKDACALKPVILTQESIRRELVALEFSIAPAA